MLRQRAGCWGPLSCDGRWLSSAHIWLPNAVHLLWCFGQMAPSLCGPISLSVKGRLGQLWAVVRTFPLGHTQCGAQGPLPVSTQPLSALC